MFVGLQVRTYKRSSKFRPNKNSRTLDSRNSQTLERLAQHSSTRIQHPYLQSIRLKNISHSKRTAFQKGTTGVTVK